MKAFSLMLTLASLLSVNAHAIEVNAETLIPKEVKTVQALREATSNCRKTLSSRPTVVCSAAESKKIAEVLRAMDDGRLSFSIVEQTFQRSMSYQIFWKKVEFKAVVQTLNTVSAVASGFKAIGCQNDSRMKGNELMCAISNYSNELQDLMAKERK